MIRLRLSESFVWKLKLISINVSCNINLEDPEKYNLSFDNVQIHTKISHDIYVLPVSQGFIQITRHNVHGVGYKPVQTIGPNVLNQCHKQFHVWSVYYDI